MGAPDQPSWLLQRPDETRDDWINRTNKSCFYCPHPAFRTGKEAENHEIECGRRTPEQRHALLADAIRHQEDRG